MHIYLHRQAIVRALIRATGVSDHQASNQNAYKSYGCLGYEEEASNHYQNVTCCVTGLYFPDKLAENLTACSEYGDLWMGLWLDDDIKIDDEGDSLVLFPRWLAEVLNEECSLGIKEKDIY